MSTDNDTDVDLSGALHHLRQLNIKSGTTTNNDQCGGVTEGKNVDVQDDTSTCASCGKIGNSHDMNVCNKCKEVKYCNAACKKKHRKKHKKACEKRAAELHDEQLNALNRHTYQ